MGIEPTRPAWKAGILPLNYTRIRSMLAYFIKDSQICQQFFKGFGNIFHKKIFHLNFALSVGQEDEFGLHSYPACVIIFLSEI